MLFCEDIEGNEIPVTRPIIRPVEKFLDSSPGLSEKIDRVRERRLIRGRQFFGYELGTGDLARAWIIAKNRHRSE